MDFIGDIKNNVYIMNDKNCSDETYRQEEKLILRRNFIV